MSLDRYHRQMLLPGFGEQGQARLRGSHALVVGCGALGTMIVDALARAGVGTLTIVDRDVVELTNLQRQVLFDEDDVQGGTPKALAAKSRIGRVNSQVTVHAHVDDFSHRNFERFVANVDLIVDGLDNFETRYLLNDIAVSRGIPYIYGGAVATTGVTMPVLPSSAMRKTPSTSNIKWTEDQSTPCLRCVFPEAPPPGTTPTCDTAGVLGPAVAIISAVQAAQAIKLLTGNLQSLDRSLFSIDLWTSEFRRFDISAAKNADCPCCARGEFEFLHGDTGSTALSMCGRNAVQVSPAASIEASMNLHDLAARLAPHGSFTHNDYLMRGSLRSERNSKGECIELTVFSNGRAIIKGVNEPEAARTIYARYIGG
jgi:adenylyltransferase/sulfurtransferase